MTYLSESEDLHASTGRPGGPTLSPTHPCFIAGQQAHILGHPRTECPYMQNGEAERHWLAGWNAEAKAGHDRDRWDRNLEDTGRGRW